LFCVCHFSGVPICGLFPTSLFLFNVHPRRTSRTRRALLVAGPSWCPHVVQCGAASGELLLLL